MDLTASSISICKGFPLDKTLGCLLHSLRNKETEVMRNISDFQCETLSAYVTHEKSSRNNYTSVVTILPIDQYMG